MHVKLLIVILLCGLSPIFAQKNIDYSTVDERMKQIPDTSTLTVSSISLYINSTFSKDEEKVRAVYFWVTKNIKYNVEKMYAVNFYENEQEIIDVALKNKMGVCMHFATLFSSICNKVGIKAYVVDGFTKQNGIVDYVPHAWNVAYINSKWQLFDPTWGAGYIQNGKYLNKLNNFHFNTSPVVLIKTHIPFDPIWQLLNYTINNTEFYQGKTEINTKNIFFNFNDSIAKYELSNDIQRYESADMRIKNQGVINSILQNRHQYNLQQIEYFKNKEASDLYNLASIKVSEGVKRLNDFISYRNNQFTPMQTDMEIQLMLVKIDSAFIKANELIDKVQFTDPSNKALIVQFKQSMVDISKNIDEQKAFVAKYLSTKKILRKSLFYKFSWAGIPLN